MTRALVDSLHTHRCAVRCVEERLHALLGSLARTARRLAQSGVVGHHVRKHRDIVCWMCTWRAPNAAHNGRLHGVSMSAATRCTMYILQLLRGYRNPAVRCGLLSYCSAVIFVFVRSYTIKQRRLRAGVAGTRQENFFESLPQKQAHIPR